MNHYLIFGLGILAGWMSILLPLGLAVYLTRDMREENDRVYKTEFEKQNPEPLPKDLDEDDYNALMMMQ